MTYNQGITKEAYPLFIFGILKMVDSQAWYYLRRVRFIAGKERVALNHL